MMMPIKSPCEESLARAASGALQPCKGPWVLIATILASSMAFIDGTVVNVALPALQTALHASVTDIQWVVESYALLLASLLLLGGSLGDLYGRRRIFLFGVLLFAIGSSWCGLASSITSLIVARGLQGIGAAFLIPGSLAIISASYTRTSAGEPSEPGLASRRSQPPSGRSWADGWWKMRRGAGSSSSIFHLRLS